MTETDIENALKARVGTAGLGWAIAFPNQDVPAPSPQPRIEVFVDRVDRRSPTYKATLVISRGILRLLCIVRVGTSTSTVNGKADQIAALFPKALSLPITGGRIIFTDSADIRAGFRVGGEWVVPVTAQDNVIPA